MSSSETFITSYKVSAYECLKFLDILHFYLFILCTSHATAHMWRSEDNLWDLVLSFHRVGPRDGTQVIRCKHQYLYSLVISPALAFLVNMALPSYTKRLNSTNQPAPLKGNEPQRNVTRWPAGWLAIRKRQQCVQGEIWNPCTALVECKMTQPQWKTE